MLNERPETKSFQVCDYIIRNIQKWQIYAGKKQIIGCLRLGENRIKCKWAQGNFGLWKCFKFRLW